MVESLEDILRRGFTVWRKNPRIALPFFFNQIVSFILIIGLIVALFFFLSIPLILDLQGVTESVRNLSDLIAPTSILMILLSLIVFLFLEILAGSFFEAGAIGMAKKAIEESKTSVDRVVTYGSLSDMMDYGSKKFIDLFLARLILSAAIIVLFGLFLVVPILINVAISERFGMFFQGFIDLGAALLGFSVVALTLLFVATPYAIVISDLGAFEGLKRGYRFFMGNKFLVFIFWFFVTYAAELIGYVVYFVSMLTLSAGLLFLHIPTDVLSLLRLNSYQSLLPLLAELFLAFVAMFLVAVLSSMVISIFIILPLTTVWWSMLYINLVEENDGTR